MDRKVNAKTYYASREWQVKKRAVEKRSNGVCEYCRSAQKTETHHLSYEHFGDEPINELIDVCRQCHDYLHARSDFDPSYGIGESNKQAILSERVSIANQQHWINEADKDNLVGFLYQFGPSFREVARLIRERHQHGKLDVEDSLAYSTALINRQRFRHGQAVNPARLGIYCDAWLQDEQNEAIHGFSKDKQQLAISLRNVWKSMFLEAMQ